MAGLPGYPPAMWWLLGLLGCGGHLDDRACACDGGHGAQRCDGDECEPCACLPSVPVEADPTFLTELSVSPGETLDWGAVDDGLALGPVRVTWLPGEHPDRLDVLRTDDGPHRLLLEGYGAVVPGVSTGFDDVARSRVTVRGFEVTGSDDKGIYWRAGDDVVIEDNVVHDNEGSPSIGLEYANRTGLPSSSFIVRNNHVYNQRGECIYIGGSEGEDQDAHAHVEVVNNLVHDCWERLGSKHDGINVKDRIGEVVVQRNVVFATHWGIEVASPGLLADNLVFDTESNGFHLNDGWGTGLSGMELLDNVVLRPGEHGARVGADRLGADDIVVDGLTVFGAAEVGVMWAGDQGVAAALDRVVLADNDVGLDGWGTATLTMGQCRVDGNDLDDDRAADGATEACEDGDPGFGDLSRPAGPDGTFFTADDPWLVEGGAGLP